MDENVKSKSSIAFIVELFMMFAILLLVIVVITEILVMTRNQSLRSKYMNEAVIAAENAAQVASPAKDPEEAAKLLGKMENAKDVSASADGADLLLEYRGTDYKVSVSMDSEHAAKGDYVASTIKVALADSGEELYELRTGNYIKDKSESKDKSKDKSESRDKEAE